MILKENLMLLKDKEDKFFGVYKGFEFLDLFLNKCYKLNFEKDELKALSVFDYRISETKKFDRIEVQSLYSTFYIEFLYENYFYNFSFYEKLRFIVIDFLKQINIPNIETENFFSKMIVRFFLFSFYSLHENKIDKEKFVLDFSKNLLVIYNQEISLEISNSLIDLFLKNDIIISSNDNFLSLFDNYFFWHLKIMSLSVVRVFPEFPNSKSYSCSHGFNSLVPIIVNLLNFRNKKLVNQNYLNKNHNNLYNLDTYLEDFSVFNSNSNLESVLFQDYMEKIALNSYCFHMISVMCFENYYYSSYPNILYTKKI